MHDLLNDYIPYGEDKDFAVDGVCYYKLKLLNNNLFIYLFI
jgi:hypothetical protein